MKPLAVLRRLPPAWALLLALALAAAGAACFHQRQPACAFSCVEPPHLCPTGYTCGASRICIRDDADPALCTLRAPDAGATDDGSADGGDDTDR